MTRLIIIFCLTLISIHNSQDHSLSLENIIDCFMGEIAIEGDLMVIAAGTDLLFYKIENPTNPEFVTMLNKSIPNFPSETILINNFLIVSDEYTINIYDIRNPRRSILTYSETSEYELRDIILYKNHLISSRDGLGITSSMVVDDFTSIIPVDTVYSQNAISQLYADNDILYASSLGQIKFFNISDLDSIYLLTEFETFQYAGPSNLINAFNVLENKLFISKYIDVISYYDISDIYNPILKDYKYKFSYSPNAIQFVNEYIILNDFNGRLMYKLSEYGALVFHSEQEYQSLKETIFIDDLCYTTTVGNGLDISSMDTTTGEITPLKTIGGYYSADKSIMIGDNILVGDFHAGLKLYKYTDVNPPVFLASHQIDGFIWDISNQDSLIFVSTSKNTHIVKLHADETFTELSNLSTKSVSNQVVDSLLFVGTYYDLLIYDIRVPSSPILLSALSLEADKRYIYVHGDVLYLSCDTDGVWSIDVSDPTTPQIIQNITDEAKILMSVDAIYGFLGAIVVDDYLYLSRNTYQDGELYIFKNQDPFNPQLLKKVDGLGGHGLKYEYNTLYTCDHGLKTINLIDKTNPLLDQHRVTCNYAPGLWVSDGKAIVTSQNEGIFIYDTGILHTPVGLVNDEIEYSFSISQNFPNPFNPTTKISYSLEKEAEVTITIFDIMGRKVKSFIKDKHQIAGNYTIKWDAGEFSSGVYFCQIKSDNITQTIKMLLLK